jgi:hypothetical protein
MEAIDPPNFPMAVLLAATINTLLMIFQISGFDV